MLPAAAERAGIETRRYVTFGDRVSALKALKAPSMTFDGRNAKVRPLKVAATFETYLNLVSKRGGSSHPSYRSNFGGCDVDHTARDQMRRLRLKKRVRVIFIIFHCFLIEL